MSSLPLPSQTLAWLNHAANAGQRDAQALLHLIARADKHDQDVAVFVDSYTHTIAALCRRLEALERGAGLRHPVKDAETTESDSVSDIAQRIVWRWGGGQAGEVAVAWCRSDKFANSMNRGGSFNGWKDPGAGPNKCDMQLYAIPLPAPQAGEVKA
jgi:hypothetical protein